MDASICVLPETDKAYKSKNSALSEDGLTCTLGGIAIFNPDKCVVFPRLSIVSSTLRRWKRA